VLPFWDQDLSECKV